MTTIAGVEVPLEHFVGGEFRSGGDGALVVVDPATGGPVAEVPRAGAAEIEAAVSNAVAAFPAWAGTSPGERAAALLKLADAVEANAEVLGRLESLNVGKPVSAVPEELAFAVDNLRFFAGGARLLEGRAAGEYLSGYTSMLRRDPVGVVAAIAPWNYPLMMAVWKLGPALAAGCTAVLKPSELTPLSTLKLAELAAEIFPPGVVNVVVGLGAPPGHRHGLPHRVRPHGQEDRRGRQPEPQARPPRARGQGPGRGARRRRPGGGRCRGAPGGVRQRRTGLHGRGAGDRRRPGP
jgi:acyl-CoA reductase-like NAD-dependent aldehyde dehydrogenase